MYGTGDTDIGLYEFVKPIELYIKKDEHCCGHSFKNRPGNDGKPRYNANSGR